MNERGDQLPSKNFSISLVALCTSSPEVPVSVHLLGVHLVPISIVGLVHWMSGHHLVVKPVVDEDVQREAEQGSCSDLWLNRRDPEFVLAADKLRRNSRPPKNW